MGVNICSNVGGLRYQHARLLLPPSDGGRFGDEHVRVGQRRLHAVDGWQMEESHDRILVQLFAGMADEDAARVEFEDRHSEF